MNASLFISCTVNAQNFPLFGHRGSGAEGTAFTEGYHRVNVQENTILSFVTAASLGAEYVEFGKLLRKGGRAF